LILAGGTRTLVPLLDRAARRGIPVVCVGADAPAMKCLTTVGADPLTSGALAAELTGRFVQGRGRLLLVTGPLDGVDQEPTLAAFRRTLEEMWPGMEVAAQLEIDDRATADYEKASGALRGNRDLACVYVSAPNPIPVLQAIDDEGLGGKVVVITNGLSSGLVPFIASGKVVATVDPRHRDQGQVAFQALYRYVAEGVRPPPAIRLAPQVVLRSNLDAHRYRPRTEGGPGELTARGSTTADEPFVS
jgi:ABC-type sugar transport system substrate-binding protein